MTDEQFIQAYPYSIKAWQAQRTLKDVVITGDEKTFYDFEVSEYAYWFNLNRNEELYQKIKELELANANLREEKSSLEAELTNKKQVITELKAIIQNVSTARAELEKKLADQEKRTLYYKEILYKHTDHGKIVLDLEKKLADVAKVNWAKFNEETFNEMENKLKVAVDCLKEINKYDTCHRCQHYIGSPNKYCEPESKCISNNRSEYLPVSDDKLKAREVLKQIQEG